MRSSKGVIDVLFPFEGWERHYLDYFTSISAHRIQHLGKKDILEPLKVLPIAGSYESVDMPGHWVFRPIFAWSELDGRQRYCFQFKRKYYLNLLRR